MTLDTEVWGGVAAATVAAGVSTLGLLSMAFLGDWARRHSPNFSAFAVGFLLMTIFFHLFPETYEKSELAGVWIGAGFIGVSFLSLSGSVFARRRVDGRDIAIGYASIIALAAHSFIDGLAYETTFRYNPVTGVLSTFGLLLHEFPEAVIAFFLVRETGMSRASAFVWAFFAASATTVLGALLAAFVLPRENLDASEVGKLMGLAAGGLLYITVFHLGYHARLASKGRGYFYTSLGIAIALAAVVLAKIFPFGSN